jgi:predicted nucleic acid-binding protein
MPENRALLVFLDANVLIEALLVQSQPAVSIMHMASTDTIKLITCKLVIDDVEEEILSQATTNTMGIDFMIDAWHGLLKRTNLIVRPNPQLKTVLFVKKEYLPLMRHLADIPVLAAAIDAKPDLILSGNRKHFNNQTAKKCGIPIFSCKEFLKQLIWK